MPDPFVAMARSFNDLGPEDLAVGSVRGERLSDRRRQLTHDGGMFKERERHRETRSNVTLQISRCYRRIPHELLFVVRHRRCSGWASHRRFDKHSLV
jgi:hypothetical protein